MIGGQHYSRAPITEAIIDLRVEPREDLTLTDLERCHAGEKEAYPNKASVKRSVGQMQLGGAGEFSHSGSTEQIGFLFKSADEKQLFQMQWDGFTMNWLGLYPGWAVFRDEARRLWIVYRDCARPRKVVRMALRYINRLDLRSQGVDLKDYLKTWPEVAADIAQPLESFVMQLAMPQNDIRGTLRLTEASVAPSGPDMASVALDIDLFRTEDVPGEEEEMWGLFEDLRHRTNKVFEACITEKTRELIR
jgi:uncharacterized protein (TIGR04255 family)